MSRRRETLMPELLTEEEFEAARQKKLAGEKARLLRDYDDSSDDDEDLNYGKVPKAIIGDAKAELEIYRLFNEISLLEIQEKLKQKNTREGRKELVGEKKYFEKLLEDKEKLEEKIDTMKGLLRDNPAYVMEIEGRKAIYRHIPHYRTRKTQALGNVNLDIKAGLFYDEMMISVLQNLGVITDEQSERWKRDRDTIKSIKSTGFDAGSFVEIEMMDLNDASLFTEENKFNLLRRAFRQANRSIVDSGLVSEISSFANKLGFAGTLDGEKTKLIVNDFRSVLAKVRRKVLPKTYTNPDIASVEDFYADELLRYRSLVRKSREIEGEEFDVAQTMVFDAENDLVSQKKQTVKKDKGLEGNKDRFDHRGTVEEEVFNLGNYETVLQKLRSTGLADAGIAITIREVFRRGAREAFDRLKVQDGDGDEGEKLSQFLSPEKQQIIVDTVELLFGTEGFRSPAAIVETNMMLDLIISDPDHWNFERAFVGKTIPGTDIENGGDLSFTMKAKEGHSGGIECGRKLSHKLDEIFDKHRVKSHRYGGAHNARKDDFVEYAERKEAVAKSWVEKCAPAGSVSLENAIQRSSNKWYSR